MILRFFLLFLLFKSVFNYILDVHYPIIYEDPNKGSRGSYFGLSVSLRPKLGRNDSWALQIGAPRGNISKSKFNEPGSVYRCSLHGPCRLYLVDKGDFDKGGNGIYKYVAKKDEAFIGVSMDVKETQNGGKNVICGHRWANKDERREPFMLTYLLTGACYLSDNSDGEPISALKILPLVNQNKIFTGTAKDAVYYWGLGQAGTSVEFDDDLATVIIGAPGIYRNGGVIKYRAGSDAVVGDFRQMKPQVWYAYAGYQVGQGKFFGDGKLWYLAGAPRSAGYRGEVIIFQFEGPTGKTKIIQTLTGKTLGEYFGASLAVSDINNDGRDDIIVGAPSFSYNEPEQGKIYVFLGPEKGKFVLIESNTRAISGKASYGKFGSCISALGDLDQDGYKDIAVGAPYENNNRGAVYIYRGTTNGLQYSMRILAEDVFEGLRGFGMSISKGIDIDGNSWKDVAIGAYLSDQVVVFRSRPLISLHPSIESEISLLDRNNALYFKVVLCSRYDGAQLPGAINVARTFELDPNYRRAYVTPFNAQAMEKIKIIQLNFNQTYCEELYLYVNPQLLNKTYSNPVEIFLTNELSKCGENKKKILFIRNESRSLEKEDEFKKWCPVETRKEVSVKIPFAGECGADDKCVADLEVLCSIAEARNNFYVVGRSKYITLVINVKNNKEPAYNTKILVDSNFEFDSREFDSYQEWNVNGTSKNVTWLDIDTVGANVRGEIKLEISTLRIQERKFNQDHIDFHVKANSASAELDADKPNNECKVSLNLLCDIEVTLLASSSPSTSSVSGDLDNELVNFTHYYEVEKFGDSPAGDAELTINIPTRYLGVEIMSIKTENSEWMEVDCKGGFWIIVPGFAARGATVAISFGPAHMMALVSLLPVTPT